MLSVDVSHDHFAASVWQLANKTPTALVQLHKVQQSSYCFPPVYTCLLATVFLAEAYIVCTIGAFRISISKETSFA